ncbi:hypothetical protein ACWGJ9_11720 [Curtobacterium citreum]
MTERETLTTRLVFETEHRSTTTGVAPLDRDSIALKALDYFGYINPRGGDQKLLRISVGDTVYDAAGRRVEEPPTSAEDQLEQVRSLLTDLHTAYPNPAPYDTAAVVIERLNRILNPNQDTAA